LTGAKRAKAGAAAAMAVAAAWGWAGRGAASEAAPVDAITQAVSACLGGAPPPVGAAPGAGDTPGLGRDPAGLDVTPIPVGAGRLYGYRTRGGAEVACGVALYGVPAARAYAAVIAEVRKSGRFAATSPAPYTIPTPAATASTYLGDVKAPGLSGVLVVMRAGRGAKEPTLQVDYHSTLVP
jgi:hypothetical protein